MLRHGALDFVLAIIGACNPNEGNTKRRGVALMGHTTTGKTKLLEMISEIVQTEWLEV